MEEYQKTAYPKSDEEEEIATSRRPILDQFSQLCFVDENVSHFSGQASKNWRSEADYPEADLLIFLCMPRELGKLCHSVLMAIFRRISWAQDQKAFVHCFPCKIRLQNSFRSNMSQEIYVRALHAFKICFGAIYSCKIHSKAIYICKIWLLRSNM